MNQKGKAIKKRIGYLGSFSKAEISAAKKAHREYNKLSWDKQDDRKYNHDSYENYLPGMRFGKKKK